MLDIEAIKKQLEAITPGGWKVGGAHGAPRGTGTIYIHGYGEGNSNIAKAYFRWGMLNRPKEGIANAAFIADAPDIVRALVEEVERLREKCGEVEEESEDEVTVEDGVVRIVLDRRPQRQPSKGQKQELMKLIHKAIVGERMRILLTVPELAK